MPSSAIFKPRKGNLNLTDELKTEIDKLRKISDAFIQSNWIANCWSIADLDLALMLNRLIKNQLVVPQKLSIYGDRNWRRESVQGWLKKQEK